jgi:alanine racemase
MPVSTWAEVDLDRFSANLAAIRGHVGAAREILLVVKAEREGVGILGVATLHEGIQLRLAGCRRPIVVLSPLLPGEIDEAVAHQLDPTIADPAFARAYSAAAERVARPLRFHVEVDTGMGRTGVRDEEADAFIAATCALPGLRLASVYTHFPDADAEDLDFARAQVAKFRSVLDRLAARGIHPPRVHASNSAGTLNLPDALFDGVRVGLIAYGHQPPNARTPLALAPVMAFKSRLVQVRELPAGTPISYSRTFVTRRPTRSGVIAVGYGHGLSWLLSSRGQVLVGGRRVPILGRVTMDLTMVDVTDVPGASVGDEVVLFGEQRSEDDGTLAEIPLEEVARWSETLPYEIMCTIGKRVTRIYVSQGRPVKLTSLVGEHADWAAQAADHFRLRAQALAAAAKHR